LVGVQLHKYLALIWVYIGGVVHHVLVETTFESEPCLNSAGVLIVGQIGIGGSPMTAAVG